ncbi:insulin-like growth factor-binding protein complex acid labile subunit isoform X1 [Anopheles funestus]|uniref:insulin-like growth factor-binding protein complex acid labile subunit isoform X1 n=1 Tax=Anopheles funestus TaxID=62324 RepID=UPI0020C742DC|nr:insulin-like growth factor-binding protein complex acid labile subunit isoform X1 [Anopheles funestus]
MKTNCAICFALLWHVVAAVQYQTVQYRCSNESFNSKAVFSDISINGSIIPQFSCDSGDDIEEISFENCSVEEMPKQLFDTFTDLQSANLDHCFIHYVKRYSLENAISLKFLDLSRNALIELTANCFSGAVNLIELLLSHNNIRAIDNTAFNSLDNLAVLQLTDNKLHSLGSKVFGSLASLQTIYLDFNELQVIERGLFSNNVQLQTIVLRNNHNSVVEEGVFNAETCEAPKLHMLYLNENNLTNLNLKGVNVRKLNLANNRLEKIFLSPWMEYVYAAHNRISNILMDNSSNINLTTLVLRNNSITSLESLQHLDSLVNLYLSNNRIGPLNLTSLTKFTKLEHLGLERTFISNLQHGTFAQQQSLKWLDLTYNNLDRFDFDILTSSTELQKIYLDGNRLKSLNFEHLKKTFPSLVEIGFSDNNWNCSYLVQLVRYCTDHSIALFKYQVTVHNQTNVKGIYCYDDKNPLANWNTTMQQLEILHPHLHNSSEDSALQTLLQSVLEDVRRFSDRHEEVTNQTTKLDGAVFDLTKNQFNLQKDLNSLRQSLYDIQLSLLSNRTNGSAGVNNDELRRMIETANNLTLDKQELSAKTLEFKIYEQTFKVDKALELAKENTDKITLLGKRVEQWISNTVGSGGVSLLAQDRQQQQQLVQQGAVHATGGGGDHGLMIAMLVMMCLMVGVIMFGFFKFNRLAINVERNRYANRESLAAMINNDI